MSCVKLLIEESACGLVTVNAGKVSQGYDECKLRSGSMGHPKKGEIQGFGTTAATQQSNMSLSLGSLSCSTGLVWGQPHFPVRGQTVRVVPAWACVATTHLAQHCSMDANRHGREPIQFYVWTRDLNFIEFPGVTKYYLFLAFFPKGFILFI